MFWFEQSAEIKSLPSPVRHSWNFRLNVNKESLNPALETIYKKVTNNSLFVIIVRILVMSIITYIFVVLIHLPKSSNIVVKLL